VTRPHHATKVLCGHAVLPRPCLAYSFGSAGDTNFERALKKVAPHCDIHTFDPTLSPVAMKKVQAAEVEGILKFHAMGLATFNGFLNLSYGKARPRPCPVRTMRTIKEGLGHLGRTVDVLKIDIESAEHRLFSGGRFAGQAGTERQSFVGKAGQVQLEVHARAFHDLLPIVRALRHDGLMLFHKDPSVCRYGCSEVAFVSAAQAFRAFKAAHSQCDPAFHPDAARSQESHEAALAHRERAAEMERLRGELAEVQGQVTSLTKELVQRGAGSAAPPAASGWWGWLAAPPA